ncbi:MAG: histidinol-phosphate transaminase [Firmicutes bacterium]|nr:histidinol-phosphate transaminase [Bacillota bacterium]
MRIVFRHEILNIEPYVPGKPISEVKKELNLTDVIKMASNENPLGPSSLAVQAVKDNLDKLHIYPDGGSVDLKDKIATNVRVAPEQVIIGNGSDEILKLIGEAFLQPDDEVIMAWPTFSEYSFVTRLMGAKELRVPLKDFTHDLEAMFAQISARTKIIFICNPNNPTGTIITHQELDEFLKKVPRHILVVVDEAYFEYVTADDYPKTLELLPTYENLIVTRTFSKIYGLAALRVGYGIGNRGIIDLINRVREPFNVNGLAQIAALRSLEDNEHLKRSLKVNEAGKNYLYSEFEQLGLNYVKTQANFILVDLGSFDADPVFNALLQKGVIIRSARTFGLRNFIRVTIGTKEQNQRFIKALKEVLTGANSD